MSRFPVLLAALFAAGLSVPLEAKNAVYDQPPEFSGQNSLQPSAAQIRMMQGQGVDSGPGAGSISGAGNAVTSGGVGSGAGDGAAPVTNFGNLNRNSSTYNAPAKKEDKKDQNGNQQPQMPQLPGGQGGDQGANGSKGGGGGCSNGCSVIGKDAADLKEAVRRLNGSDDPALKALGKSLEPYAVTDQEAKTSIDRATLEMKNAKAAADDAANQLQQFATPNKSDTDKFKEFAKDAEQKGKDAKECDMKQAGKADAPSGTTSRSTKLPSGAEGRVKEARKAADAAQRAADALKEKAGELNSAAAGKVAEITAMQSKLGSIATDNKKLQALVQRAARNAQNQYDQNVAPTLKEVEDKVKAVEEALTAAQKADPTAEKAAKTADAAKTAMTGASTAVAAAIPNWGPTDAQKTAACGIINPQVSMHKAEAPKPKPDAETASKDAEDAKTKADKAAGMNIRAI